MSEEETISLAATELRKRILAAPDATQEPLTPVEAPEWGLPGGLFVRVMSGTERDAWESSLVGGTGKNRKADLANIRAKLVATCLCDAAGGRVFMQADVVALGRKSSKPLDRIFSVCQKVNGLSDDDVDELAKNSDGDPSDDSGSDSPGI